MILEISVKSAELSKYIWSLQERGTEFTIHCKILSHDKGFIAVIAVCISLKNYDCSIILTICTYLIKDLKS